VESLGFEKSGGKWVPLLLGLAVLLGLYVCSLYNYLLFQPFGEILSIAVSWGIFFIVWNTRSKVENSSLFLIGIAYFFVGSIDILHTLAYKGLGVFAGYDADLPTQLWIAARYVQAASLAIAPRVPDLRQRWRQIFAGYLIVTAFLVGSIFSGFFPHCFSEGTGLTSFKIASDYVIAGLIVIAAIGLHLRKRSLDEGVIRWLMLSLAATLLSVLSFTLYVNVYDLPNLIGHYFKILATWFMYKALIEYGLDRPPEVLFREHKQFADALKESEAKLLDLYAHAPVTYFSVSAENGTIIRCNKAAGTLLGCDEDELIGRHVSNLYSDGPSGKSRALGVFSRFSLFFPAGTGLPSLKRST
jgi:PAS domain-containing protein